jgi:nitroreductase
MSGIVFYNTKMLDELVDFYQTQLGMEIWLRQVGCTILQHGNLLVGFCQSDRVQNDGLITLFYENPDEVDAIHSDLGSLAEGAPKVNEKYRIYHFYARDPEDRGLEFQTFLHPLESYLEGIELLKKRRSIRSYTDDLISDALLKQLVEDCRHAPTSRNSQSYFFHVLRDRETIEFLAQLRGTSSKPLAAAQVAVAIYADPELTKRADQDACIAAYHFTLAARSYGLGTCWIAAMDRQDVKERLGIPERMSIATITPLGYPVSFPATPPRREVDEILRGL